MRARGRNGHNLAGKPLDRRVACDVWSTAINLALYTPRLSTRDGERRRPSEAASMRERPDAAVLIGNYALLQRRFVRYEGGAQFNYTYIYIYIYKLD